MEFEFAIPISLNDLQTKQSLTDYSVSEVFPTRILPNKLADLKVALRSFDKDTVITHFDSLYSVLCDKSAKEDTLRETAWIGAIKCVESLHTLLRPALEGGNVRDPVLRNATSMSLYLLTEYIDLLENASTKPSTDQLIAGKKKKGKSRPSNDNLSMDWVTERHRAIRAITQVMSLPIQRLWDPPMVDQSIINCIGNMCFKLLQNADTVKIKETKEDIFRLMGTLIKRHKYSLSAAIQAMECLKLFEHMASTMAEAMAVITREFSFPKTAQDLLREISSLSADYLQKDGAAARSYSSFLVELADMIPDVILPVIAVLLPFLESDPPSMRNSMLQVLGKLVMNLLTGDNLDENHKNMREEFLDTLCEHMHDCNGFVRAKALQVLTSLVEARTLPVSRYIEVATLTQGRLLDKLANVRKYAMQLMITIISHNPYGATLSDKELVEALEAEKAKLADLRSKVTTTPLPEAAVITPAENWDAMLPETEKAVRDVLESSPDLLSQERSRSLDDSLTSDSIKDQLIVLMVQCRHSQAVKLLLDCQHGFTGTDLELSGLGEEESEDNVDIIVAKLKEIFLTQTVPEAMEVEESEDNAEIKELIGKQRIVVKYLEESNRFCLLLHNTMPTVCKLLSSKTPSDVVESIQFVINTVQFGVTDAMHGLAAMLKLIWVPDANIKSAVVQAFRQLYLYSEDTGNCREADRVVASLVALTKAFGAVFGLLTSWEEMVCEFVRSDDITSKVLNLLWQTFTKKLPNVSDVDSKIALHLISMAARARPAIVSSNMDTLLSEGLGEKASKDFRIAQNVCQALLCLLKTMPRLGSDHEMVTSLVRLMANGITDATQCCWIPMMEQAVKFIYALSETPDVTCGDLIKQVYPQVIVGEQVNLSYLARFVSLVGQVALCQVTYLEGDVLQDIKKGRQKPKNHDKTADSTVGADELGQTTNDDVETEVILKVIDLELLQDKNLLSCFLPMLTRIINNRAVYDDVSLQAAATLALGKYMLISPTVCRQNLRLYFTVLEKSTYTEVKTNAIVALSDMVFRYPNELEPWTPNLYARLRDKCPGVRKSTLMVMTRLILNDMVKVKGQISEIASRLVDEVEAIKQMAAQFFAELANKGRALYNVLLDIVSRLSDPEVGVDEDQFRTICTELFSHTSNDKQSESLMERFVLRFRATTDERQWRDLAFCLSLLTYSEKSIKKLIELFSCFADKLADDDIYESFSSIIEKTGQKLKLKPGAGKEVLAELSAKIELAHNRGVEDADALENASESALNRATTKAANRKKKTRKSRRGASQSDDDDDYPSDSSISSRKSTSSNVSVTQRVPSRRSTRAPAPMKPIENLLSSLDEESEEEEEALANFTKSTQKKKAPITDKKRLVFSSSDEDEDDGVCAAAVLSPAPARRQSTRTRAK